MKDYSADKKLSKRYAKSLLNIASKTKKEEAILGELQDFASGLKSHEVLYDKLNKSSVTRAELKDVIDAIAKKMKLSKIMVNFINLLIENHRVDLFFDIVEDYETFLLKKKNMKKAKLISAKELDAKEIKKIEKVFNNKLKENLILEQEKKESLLSGFKILIGSNLYDASLSGRLKRLKNELLS